MSQMEALFNLLSDGLPHRTDEIMRVVYGGDHLGLSRIGARIYDIKKRYHVEIEGRRDTVTPSLFWYQMIRTDTVFDSIQRESDRMMEEKKFETAQPSLF